jgi:hypothetical protein
MPSKPAAMALRAARRNWSTTWPTSAVPSARGADTGSKPAGVKVLVCAGRAVDDTGCSPAGSSEACEMRPTCQIWATIRPPLRCTASVTRFQPATCSGL